MPATLADEEFKLGEQAAVTDKGSDFQADMLRRTEAATAFLKANTSLAVRASLLARSRPARREYEVGEWVYYWKEAKGPYLEKVHWHGPAMVCVKQPKLNDNDVVVTMSIGWFMVPPSSELFPSW